MGTNSSTVKAGETFTYRMVVSNIGSEDFRGRNFLLEWHTPLGTAGPGFAARYGRAEDTPLLDFINEVQRRRAGADLSAATDWTSRVVEARNASSAALRSSIVQTCSRAPVVSITIARVIEARM